MKKSAAFLIVIASVISGCASLQQTSQEDLSHPIAFVYDFKMSKQDIFKKSAEWFARATSDDKLKSATITLSDKDDGKIIGIYKGAVSDALFARGYSCIVTVEVKDNKARISFDSLKSRSVGKFDGTDIAGINLEYQEQFDLVKTDLSSVANQYQSFISKKSDSF